MIHNSERKCPRCGFHKMRLWRELEADEKLLAEKLPASAEFTKEQRKKHRFCTRCWFEAEDTATNA